MKRAAVQRQTVSYGPSYTTEESCGGQNRRRYESAVAGRCAHEFGTDVITFAGEASELVSLVFRPGVRAVLAMTLMAMGKYQEPAGCYIPSIQY